MNQILKFVSPLLGCTLFVYGLLLSCCCSGSGKGFHKIKSTDNLLDEYLVPHRIIGECRDSEKHSYVLDYSVDEVPGSEAAFNQLLRDKGFDPATQVIRVKPVSRSYNAHGLTLDNGNSTILNEYVKDLLQSAGYVNIQDCTSSRRPIVGDIAVYQNAGRKVTHSGLVIAVDAAGETHIRSKWGDGPEYEHHQNDVSEDFRVIIYYRKDCNN